VPPSRNRRKPPRDFIRPYRPLLVAKPPSGPGWLHEVKHDGYRIIAFKQDERVVLWTRHGSDFTAWFPRIAAAVRSLPIERAMIDGEAVVFHLDGRSHFAALRTKAGGKVACLAAFDLLSVDGMDLRTSPIEDRRDRLAQLVRGIDAILFSEALEEDGARVFAKVCEMNLEGIVSKRVGSRYFSGNGRQWLKVKNPDFGRG
jgi:bifunctional non-homologous end joining protein LigD